MENLEGKYCFFMCSSFYYWGRVVNVGLDHVVMDDCHIVYETGAFKEGSTEWKDAQKTPLQPWNVRRAAVESWGVDEKKE